MDLAQVLVLLLVLLEWISPSESESGESGKSESGEIGESESVA